MEKEIHVVLVTRDGVYGHDTDDCGPGCTTMDGGIVLQPDLTPDECEPGDVILLTEDDDGSWKTEDK